MLKNFCARIYIQIDYRLMNVRDWLSHRKMVKRSIQDFYSYKKQDYFCSMCCQAEWINENLCEMARIYPRLTSLFETIHHKKLEDPINGFRSGKYDLLKEEG